MIADKINPEDYLKLIIKRRDKIADSYDLSDGKDWAIIAITDHNSCDFSCKLSEHAWKTKKENRIVILPGMELEVEFKVLEQNYTKVHICIIFAPCVEKSQIYSAIISAYKDANKTQNSDWNFGNSIRIENIETFISKLRNNPSFPALCIAAHVGSSKGIRRETVEVIEEYSDFTRTQAEYARLTAELEEITAEKNGNADPNSYKKKEVESKIKLLETTIMQENQQINVDTLKLIGRCGFDALQVSNKQEDIYYRCLHRFKDEYGRAVTILCSDAHRIQDMFNCGNELVTYVKFPSFNSRTTQKEFFQYLKERSIRFGETRFTSVSKNRVSCFIKGIEISPDTPQAKKFWPFKNDKFTIPFSSNLNCLIGGRGSGKSAMIEALSFLLDNNDEFNKAKSNKEQEDWYKRAVATLSGCKIKLCWVSSKESFSLLQKKSVFLDRFFSSDDNYMNSKYRDINGNEITDEAIKSDCRVQLYRMGELEKKAVNVKEMRNLFDDICGNEIKSIEGAIQSVLIELKGQKGEIKKVFQDLSKLTKDDSPLRKFVLRKKQYDEVNTKEMKEQFDKLDVVVKAKQITDNAYKSWQNENFSKTINDLEVNSNGFFDEIDIKTKNADGSIIPNTEILRNTLFDKKDGQNSLKEDFLQNINQLADSITKTSSAMEGVNSSITTKEKEEHDKLEKAGMPTGSKQREAKKISYEEALQAVANYEKQWTELCNLYKQRIKNFERLKECAKKRTELRDKTAKEITSRLKKNLDASVLVIEADARPIADRRELETWLDKYLFPSDIKYKAKKIEAYLENELLPEKLRKILFANSTSEDLVVNQSLKASEGKVDSEAAIKMVEHSRVCYNFNFDDDIKEHGIDKEGLPDLIKKGIKIFIEDERKIEAFLLLDEIVFDDIPEIRLKDRPNEMQVARPITELSPGQRCSAILPIILLNGDCPLIIDQPEDNLDNRLVREVVVNILAAMKLQRQVIMATHNPNLPVLGDVEQAIILKAIEQNNCELQTSGDIDRPPVVRSITEIMEGGREAFQYRQSIYQTHWNGPVEEILQQAEVNK